MKVLHLLVAGNAGGIEVLMRNSFPLSAHENYFAFLWGGGQVADEMASAGAEIMLCDVRKDGMPATLKKVAALCREKGIELVLSHNSAPLLKIALVYIKMLMPRVSIVAYAHANAADICEHKRSKGLWLRKLVHRMAFAKADGIIAISESVKQSLVSYLNVNEDKIKVIHNGVPLPAAASRSTDKNTVRLVYVGRLIKEKGVHVTLEALSELADEFSFEFRIVGDGVQRQALERLAAEKGIAERVSFVGVSREVTRHLSESDIFIHMPVWEEGFGITVIEAMAAGCLCVCAAKGGIPEIITNDQDGCLVYQDTAEALADTLRRVIPEYMTGRCVQLVRNARLRAEDFSIEKYSAALDEYLDSIKQQ